MSVPSALQNDELSPAQVRARFSQARRNGFPAWLWPDISIAQWRAAVEAIAAVTRKIMAGESRAALIGIDAKTIGIAGYTSGMGPLLGYWIENGMLGATSDVEEVFRVHLTHNRQRMTYLAETAGAVLGALTRTGLSPVVLKGMHTAFSYFPEPGTRPLSDIDVYLPRDSVPAAERILDNLGYEPTLRTRFPYACDWTLPLLAPEPRTLAYVHKDDAWSFDILGSLDKRLMTGARICLGRLLTWDNPDDWRICNGVGVLRQPHLTLYLAAHISQTLMNATLLRLTELALVVRGDTAAGKLDWSKFLEGAARIGGARFVYPALVLCDRLAPQTIPRDVLAAVREAAPPNLRHVVDKLSLSGAQPLDRHSVSERFMWASSWSERLRQVAAELAFDGRGRPLGQTVYSAGSKLWALRRGRYSA